MFAVMMERSPDSCRDPVADFLTTGRTGRRNAMADILGEHVSTGLGDLPDKMEMMNTQGELPANIPSFYTEKMTWLPQQSIY